jgi:hypothetical protein
MSSKRPVIFADSGERALCRADLLDQSDTFVGRVVETFSTQLYPLNIFLPTIATVSR